MTKCYLCSEEITESNKSEEHIIPSQLGGTWKSPFLLCRDCNSKTGHTFDKTLNDFASFMCVKHNIKRDTGYVEFFRGLDVKTGKKIKLFRDGSRIYENHVTIDHTPGNVLIQADSYERGKNEINKFLKENPDIADKKLNVHFEWREIKVYEEFEFRFPFESPLFLRTAVKTMINFYLASEGTRNLIEPAIAFLIHDYPIHAFINPLEISKQHHNSDPIHIVFIRGSKKNRAIYGYFEIFGQIGVVSMLNYQYRGDDFELDYLFDPIKKERIQPSYTFSLDVSKLIARLAELNNY